MNDACNKSCQEYVMETKHKVVAGDSYIFSCGLCKVEPIYCVIDYHFKIFGEDLGLGICQRCYYERLNKSIIKANSIEH